MGTPTKAEALAQYQQLEMIAQAIVAHVRGLFRRQPSQIVPTIIGGQLRAAEIATRNVALWDRSQEPLTVPSAFAGWTSEGLPVENAFGGLVETLQQQSAAIAAPELWRLDAATESTIFDAGRSAAQTEIFTRPTWTNYVRMIVPPACDRCAILAGRIYRDSEAFARHPRCKCIHVPVTSWQDAHDAGLVASFAQAFENGHITGLSIADARAIKDGADPASVVNATRGLHAPGITSAQTIELYGRKIKITTDGVTKRAAWRKENPNLPVRLRPESIYQHAKDHQDGIRLLKLYGYIK